MRRNLRLVLSTLPLALAATLIINTGCKKAPTDAELTTQVQSLIASDPGLQGQQITAQVVDGAATLSGSVPGQAARVLAGNDAAKVSGVKTVVNNLVPEDGSASGQMAQNTAPAAPIAPAPAPAPAPVPVQRQRSSTPPAAPAAAQALTIPSGTRIRVQLGETLSSKTSHTGDSFSGTLANPITVDGQTIIRAGAQASGTVTNAKSLGRFKGQAVLAVQLNSISANGRTYSIQTNQVERVEQGKGKRSAIMTGGGAGLGAIVGGLAGGGKGALVGGLLGGGAGGAGSALTGNKDLVLPAESVVTFVLQNAVPVK